MYASRRSQTHQVNFLPRFLGVGVGSYNLRILENTVVTASAVNLHKILIHNASGANVQVAHLRVAHLAVRQTHTLTASQQLRMREFLQQCIPVGRGSAVNDV